MSPSYVFPNAEPFSGPRLYNPYARSATRWLKVNLHVHTRAWGGITNGRSTAAETVRRYRAAGFDVAAISNYQSIAAKDPNDVAAYEQGYSLLKAHLLVVGARRVDWWDYPFFEGADEKQDRIDRLRRRGALVIIAHPELRDGFSISDFRRLTGYDAVEVASHFGDGEARWDAGLSAGRLSWAIGNDDSHNSADPRQTARVWTMVAARSTAPRDVIDAIRAGLTYAVVSRVGGGHAEASLTALVTRGDTIDLYTSGEPATIRFVGQNGRTLGYIENAQSARYVLPADEPYARAVVETDWSRLILNPVVRTTGVGPPLARNASTSRTPVSLAGAVALMIFLL
jgi:hypothetical protein